MKVLIAFFYDINKDQVQCKNLKYEVHEQASKTISFADYIINLSVR